MPSYDAPPTSFIMNHSQGSYSAMSTMTPKKALCVVTVEPDKQTKNRRKRTQYVASIRCEKNNHRKKIDPV